MLDLTILFVGVLRAPITGRVLLALVTRLLLYFTNGVALYALAATVLQNGRPATPTGDKQFLADLVNALLQPAQYVTNQDTLSTNLRLKRATGFDPKDLTPAEINILRALMLDPLHSFPTSETPIVAATKPNVPPTSETSRVAASKSNVLPATTTSKQNAPLSTVTMVAATKPNVLPATTTSRT